VPAPLTDDYREGVLWQALAAADRPVLPPRPLPRSTDVVVVGAGYAGLSAAHALAERGTEVVVVERDPVGTGASTRNGGMVIPELKAGPRTLATTYGEPGRAMYREVTEAFDHVESLTGPGGIACDYRRTGRLYLAHSPRRVETLRHLVEEHRSLGEPVRFVPREELGAEIGSSAHHAGVVFERTGALNPARFHAGLVRRALDAGAEVHDRTPAVRVEPRREGGFLVATPRGVVQAARVLLCTNATADAVLPWLQRRVVPVGSYIIATEVLDEDLARSVSPRDRMFVDTKHFLFYWRLTPDRRVLFGGRRSLRPTTVPDARDFLHDAMVRLHPQLAGIRVAWAWGGNVAITVDRLPHAGVHDGIWFVTGCNGSGVALNTWLGRRTALAMVGEAPVPACARIPFPGVPLWSARSVTLPIAGVLLGLDDRRG
jgi:glycine/D-amino acid oxidase-like deaminating enzyme